MMTVLFGTVLPWLLVAVGAWLGYQLIRQNGRILLRLEAIDKRLSPRGDDKPKKERGLRIGTVAPDFELPDLAGERHKLSEFRATTCCSSSSIPNADSARRWPTIWPLCRSTAKTGGPCPSWSLPAIAKTTCSLSGVTVFVVRCCCRKKWKSPRSSMPGERPWATASIRRAGSPAN